MRRREIHCLFKSFLFSSPFVFAPRPIDSSASFLPFLLLSQPFLLSPFPLFDFPSLLLIQTFLLPTFPPSTPTLILSSLLSYSHSSFPPSSLSSFYPESYAFLPSLLLSFNHFFFLPFLLVALALLFHPFSPTVIQPFFFPPFPSLFLFYSRVTPPFPPSIPSLIPSSPFFYSTNRLSAFLLPLCSF